jgi:hypothetical protein
MIIFESPKVTVKYDNSIPSVIWTPILFMSGDEWRIPFTTGMDFLEKEIKSTPNICWLNDTRKLKTVGIDDLNWLNKNVNNRAFKLGVKKVGFVLPENVFGKMAVKFYVEYTNKRSDNTFQIKAFVSYKDATEWLSKAFSSVQEAKL